MTTGGKESESAAHLPVLEPSLRKSCNLKLKFRVHLNKQKTIIKDYTHWPRANTEPTPQTLPCDMAADARK